ncbi:MAG: hypothetical protein M3O70_03495 [Actinomycetota bacterium]|nr:hypothetical protein [Actinomycetota bacterium]
MPTIGFADVDLAPETETLFCQMASASLSAAPDSEKMFLLAVHMGGNHLRFVGRPRLQWDT